MSILFAAPGKYIQGRGELRNLSRHLSSLGSRALVIASESGIARIRTAMEGADCSACALHFAPFGGECSMGEISRMQEQFRSLGSRTLSVL